MAKVQKLTIEIRQCSRCGQSFNVLKGKARVALTERKTKCFDCRQPKQANNG